MWILILFVFHSESDFQRAPESNAAITAEFSNAKKCENAAAEIHRQKTPRMRVMWTCSAK